MPGSITYLSIVNLSIACIISAHPGPAPAQSVQNDGYTSPTNYPHMTSLWDEEFNETTLDSNYWNFQIGNGCPALCGWGNKELQCYKKENTKVENGFLIIEAKVEATGTNDYSSSRITTQ